MELVRLYEELHTFKDDHEFIRLGFGQGGPYSAWLQAIQRYRDTNSGFEISDELGFLPGDLMMLGMNYIGEDPSESDLSAIEFFEGKIQAGLAFARCDEIDPNWRGTIQASLKARQSYAAEAEAQVLARESLLGRPLTDEEREELAFGKLRDVLGLTAREDEELALAQLRPLIDQMREIGEQRKQEYEAALDRFRSASALASADVGTWPAALAAGETVLALATEIAAEISALATELEDLEVTAPPEVAALAATNRMDIEQAFALFESVVEGLQEQLEVMRAFVAELSIDERSTPRSRVTLEMLGDARLAIKDSDARIVEVGLGGQGGIGIGRGVSFWKCCAEHPFYTPRNWVKTPSASSRNHGQTWRQRTIPSLLAAQGLLCVRLARVTNKSLWRDRRVDLSPKFHGNELLERERR